MLSDVIYNDAELDEDVNDNAVNTKDYGVQKLKCYGKKGVTYKKKDKLVS